MKRSMKISTEMYKVLIERTLDGFSVIELRDEFIVLKGSPIDPDEARKKVYRQILRFIKKGWLRCEGIGRQKRYFQTDTFKALSVEAKSGNVDIEITSKHDYSVLASERNQYKGELEIVLGEIDEYQSLKARFPELEPKLDTLFDEARNRSAYLLGKINGLTNVLKVLYEGKQAC
ncbi:hypothetical protein QNE95_002928 [Vibrio vulnificus]|nr:hypothetical protein [Vibrio vulnificus]MDT8796054.1 hypothetical protein [Vibrio cholerae]ELV8599744.1 hypothetical protein [Vibrio vulnificus]MBN8112973.1 hypothetical protein [Vibrio vulnificus]MDT8829295.1 hypothetical protein [Vibrio cholerae]